MSDRLANFLFRLTHPTFWLQNCTTCEAVDAVLNALMDAEAPVKMGSHTTRIADLEVWTCNWPYAYGSIYGMGDQLARPLTRVRLRKYIARKTAEQQLERMRTAA